MGKQVPKMMTFHVPDNLNLMAAVGLVALRHSHLDHMLRMTIKTLGQVEVAEAMDATEYQGSATLRDRIKKLAKQKLGEGAALIKVQALMERCRRATEKRNDLVHSIWAAELGGAPKVLGSGNEWKPLPTMEQLTELELEMVSLATELNIARLDGFIADAMKKVAKE